MTPSIVIDKLNRLKPSALSDPDIIDMINELESEIAKTFLFVPFVPVTELTMEEELLAPVPYERIYFEFLSGKIDLINGNIEAYSLTSNQFNSDYDEMKKYCIRTGLTPLSSYSRNDYF